MSMSGADQYNIEDMPMEVMCDDLFDQIDDLLDFPNYYYEDNHFEIGGEKGTPADTAAKTTGGAGPPPVTCKQERSVGADNPDKVLQFDHEIGIAADLEWVSNFMDDTNETFSLPTSVKKEVMDRTPSPNSVLKCGGGSAVSSSSSSSSFSSYSSNRGQEFNPDGVQYQPNTIISAVPARARSKRPRPSTSSDHRPRVILSTLQQEFIGESMTPPAAERKITIKIRNPQYTEITTAEKISCNFTTVRKCLHCEVTKTPQWRAGPMGPKSLCNACGVRYKSGRLFPEYRPAASPTFVPSVHSNSHKKVVEMRIQKPTQGMASRGGCDLLNYIRKRD